MIVALLLGRKGSTAFPGKNTFNVLGKPLAHYPMHAALHAKLVQATYLSTDDPKLMEIARQRGVELIKRPDYLCTSHALGEDAFRHGFLEIQKRNPDQNIELLVLLFCNAATITSQTIDQGIEMLTNDPEADSVVTVSRYNMWSPLRARRQNSEGYLEPFVPLETFGDPTTLNCDRDSQGDVLFADMGMSIVRARCLEHLETGLLPQKWMGKRILPLRQEAGCDVDYEWQIPVVEWWLRKFGDKNTFDSRI